MEAMKMEVAFKAPRGGIATSTGSSAGDQVPRTRGYSGCRNESLP
jgi:acetyl/propionyl-CoA carboxylase alpha subunit